MGGTTGTDDARDFWIDQAARLIHIRDPQIPEADAETLASALWERPIGNRNEDTVQTLTRRSRSTDAGPRR